jgi:cytochrome P450
VQWIEAPGTVGGVPTAWNEWSPTVATTLESIDLYDPDGYVDGPPHAEFALLRREHPVYWQDMPDGTGYWALLRHADVVDVAREPTLFSAQVGGVVLEDMPAEQLEQTKNMLLMMDPPRHTTMRRDTAPYFKARAMARLEDRVREICRSIMAFGAERRDVEFTHDIAARLPSQVFGELMGIPEADRAQINRWAEMTTGGQDPDVNPDGYTASAGNGSAAMAMYGIEFAKTRRAAGGDDVGALLLATEIDGQPMSDLEFGYFFVQLVTAGNDTTRTMLSSGLLALLQHPDQLAAVRADRSLIPRAVEEILRWANPLHYFRRTATAETVIADQPIAAGDKLAMIYTSANRDEAVFADPQRFDVRRDPNPHLSFGIAEHFCLGVHLARLEGRIFFEELLRAFPTIELTGAPRRQRSNLNNALKDLPVRLTP